MKKSIGSIFSIFHGSYTLAAGYMILPNFVYLKLQMRYAVAFMSSKFFAPYHSLSCHADFRLVRANKDTVLRVKCKQQLEAF
jgi:hypothetical protein